MALYGRILLFSLLVSSCLAANSGICLYSGSADKTLKPLQIFNSNCPANTSYCMNAIYKYNNFQYNGVASLKPAQGEVNIFLAIDEQGKIVLVIFLNSNVVVTSKVAVEIDGCDPTGLLLLDDPGDVWLWDSKENHGNFSWATQPGYTDGVIIGFINFIDNYCVKTSFIQSGGINKVSILSGNITNVQRVISQTYTSGSLFSFCQYPVTANNYTNATCPNSNDGTASIQIVVGPSNMKYQWVNSAGVTVGTTAKVTGLAGGVYTVYVTDPSSDGCNAQRTVTVYDHTLNGANVKTTPFNCSVKGTASATAMGGSGGYTYSWYMNGTTTPISSGSSISGLNIGVYFVRTTDSCGSSVDTYFTIGTAGCCGDGVCQSKENCNLPGYCYADCGVCCGSGTIIVSNACRPCPAGSRSTALQSTSCTSCPANTFNAGGNDTCAPCPANTVSNSGSGKCTRCPAGQSRTTSASSCSACAAGTHASSCDNADCSSCAAGTFSESGATTCMTCLPGTFASAGSSSCSQCTAGTYSLAGASSCTSCPTGLNSPAGATHPMACN